ncbi:MAG: lysophospholipid acyltransferase family protein, partial [Acidobacteriaceae bacterium]
PARLRTRLAVAMSGELLRGMRYPAAALPWWRRVFEKLQYALVVALFNVQPLPQQSDFRRSFDNLGLAADRGYSVVVFPEGKRTTSGEMSPFRSGIGLLAARMNLPVVPMRIDGLFGLKQAGKHYAAANAITVHIGEPLRFEGDADAEASTREMQRRVEEL